MNRLVAVVAATAAAAAVAAAITIPAGADSGDDAADAAFVTCLRSHGAAIPADTRGVAIKQWLIAHEQDNGVNAALDACNVNTGRPDRAAPEELVSCLRGQGLDVPSANGALKDWLVAHRDDANAQEAFKACKFDPNPPDKMNTGQAPADLAKCLRSNGADIPADIDPVALKQWIGAHQDSDAVTKCAGTPGKPDCGGQPAGTPETRPAPEATKTPEPSPTLTVEQ